MSHYAITVMVIQEGESPKDAKEHLEAALGEIIGLGDFEVVASVQVSAGVALRVARED